MGKPQKTKTRGGEAIKVERTKVLSSLSQRSTFVHFPNFKMNEAFNWFKSKKGYETGVKKRTDIELYPLLDRCIYEISEMK